MEEQAKTYIAEAKTHLQTLTDVKAAFSDIRSGMLREVEAIRTAQAQGTPVIPEVAYKSISDNTVTDATRNAIRARGCAIVRGVFEPARVADWNAEVGDYIARNDYLSKAKEKAGLDTYFSDLAAGTPQIYGLYWSKPQVMARQDPAMAATKRFMNRLWSVAGPMGDEFDPDNDFAYADRTRRRQPGDTTLGLSPHMDSGSYERWLDPAYQKNIW
ncbi:MAG: YbiU family protein [Pseudomonadota bacterium]